MSRPPFVVMSGGGTGGHLYPALAIADALRAERPDVDVVFVGAERGIEARVLPERGEAHVLLPVRGIDRSNVLGSWRAFTGLFIGLARTMSSFARRRPDLVVVTGGYAGAAAGIAAGLMGIPLVLQEQNSYPGAVTRLLTRFATRIHVAFPEAIGHLAPAGTRCVVSGNPVRPPSESAQSDARVVFAIPGDATLTFVTGGSQGSRALNVALVGYVEEVVRGAFVRPGPLHLLWVTGPNHFDAVSTALTAAGEPDWVHTLPYCEDMLTALAAADFALCRAGAMTTAEMMNQGLPPILVPLPTSAEGHQMYNARALEAAGAARVLPESELTPQRLADEFAALLADPTILATMRVRARERARPEATARIASDVATLLPPLGRAA